jgi:hypothetical protein
VNTLQTIKKRDLSFAYEIAKAEHSKLSAMCVGQSADDLANGFYGPSLAGVLFNSELAIDQIAMKLDRLDC